MTTQIAHFNWGVLIAPWGDPAVAEFDAALDAVNALAVRSRGYVWHLSEDEMSRAQETMWEIGPVDRVASTLSVWQSVQALAAFTYGAGHGALFRRRAEWFEPQPKPRYVLWSIPAGTRPTMAEAMDRRARLRREGPGPEAFDFAYAEAGAA